MANVIPNGENSGERPRTSTEIVAGLENGTITGITAQEFVQLFQTISASMEVTKRIVDMAAESQKDAQANIKDAIAGDSDILATVAQNLETDAARLDFTKLYLEREKEKTKQAKTAAKVNKDNNKFYTNALGIVGVIILGGLRLAAGIRRVS